MGGAAPLALPIHHPAPSESDESLVARVLEGDRSAFDNLYERYFTCVFAHAARRGGTHEEVQAAAGEILAAVVSSLEEFQRQAGRVSFAAWVLGYATRGSRPAPKP